MEDLKSMDQDIIMADNSLSDPIDQYESLIEPYCTPPDMALLTILSAGDGDILHNLHRLQVIVNNIFTPKHSFFPNPLKQK